MEARPGNKSTCAYRVMMNIAQATYYGSKREDFGSEKEREAAVGESLQILRSIIGIRDARTSEERRKEKGDDCTRVLLRYTTREA